MKSKSKFESDLDEFCDRYGAEVAQSLFAAVLLIAAVVGLFFCQGCGGPAFEENLFADNPDARSSEDVGLPPPPPPPGLLDAGAISDVASESQPDAWIEDGCLPLPPDAQRWGTSCEKGCELCVQDYTCACLEGCGQSICPTSTLHCSTEGGVLVAACY